MKVNDLIASRKEIYSISDTTTVHEAARYLRDKGVRAVGVLDAVGRLVGVVSQSDISDKVAAENKCPAWMRVSEIMRDRKSTRLNSSHGYISYAVFCLKKKKKKKTYNNNRS